MLNRIIPDGLSVISDLYKDHLIFALLIGGALFAGGYLLHP